MHIENQIQTLKNVANRLPARVVAILIYFTLVVILCFLINKKRHYDFDQMMYAACAIENKDMSAGDLHYKTYELVRRDLGDAYFKRFTDSSNYYRKMVFESADNFYSQLPLYKIKYLYVAMLRTGWHFNISPFLFSTLLNVFCFVVLAMLVFYVLAKKIGFMLGAFFATSIILMPAVLEVATYNSPDLLTGLLFFSATVMLMRNRFSRYISILLFCLLVLTRPENIVFVSCFCLLALICKDKNYDLKFILPLLILCWIAYCVLTELVQPYPYSILYRHSFSGYIPDLQNAESGLSIREYSYGLRFLFNSIFHSGFAMIVLFLGLIFFRSSKNTDRSILLISASILLSLVLRCLLFPDVTMRFYSGPLLVTLVLFLRSYFIKKVQLSPEAEITLFRE
jgi:hypothetical protein